VNLSAQGVANVINRVMAEGAERRGLLHVCAAEIYVEPSGALLSTV
jgi:hypothetical protein